VLELTKWSHGKAAFFKDPAAAIPATTKSAFTRELNKDGRAVHSAEGQIKGMKKSKGKKSKAGARCLTTPPRCRVSDTEWLRDCR
jgi:hypothetical protein